MQTINDLLDAAKAAQNLETDMALASALGVGRAAVSGWRHGQRLPDPVACAALAGLTGEPLAKVLGIVGEARAISREEKAVWRKLASAAAAVLLLAGMARPALAEATLGTAERQNDLYIMRNSIYPILPAVLRPKFGLSPVETVQF